MESDPGTLRRLEQLAENAETIKQEFAAESRRFKSDREALEIKIRTLELNKNAVGAIHQDLAKTMDLLKLKDAELSDMRRQREISEEKVERLQSELRVARKLREDAEAHAAKHTPAEPNSHVQLL